MEIVKSLILLLVGIALAGMAIAFALGLDLLP